MDHIIIVVFALTYLGMAAGRIPGLAMDRSGIALVGAVLLVGIGALPGSDLAEAVHFPTLLLLAGLMVLSARFGVAGVYGHVMVWAARRAENPLLLLGLTVLIGGVLSAVLVNDIVAFAVTPLLCNTLVQRGLDPRPFLFGLAAASNAGSTATLIGNPQNILIGQVGNLDFWDFALFAFAPAIVALLVVFVCTALVWRKSLSRRPAQADITVPPLIARQAGSCLAALGLLLLLFATPLPREMSALLVAGGLMLSRTIPNRQLLGGIDVPLLILFASLFIVSAALATTGIPQSTVGHMADIGISPSSITFLASFAVLASNTIGNVPAVIILLDAWPGLSEGTLTALAILSTLAGNLFLVGSLANIIVAERAMAHGVRLTFADHARTGVPITLLSMLFAGFWLWIWGYV